MPTKSFSANDARIADAERPVPIARGWAMPGLPQGQGLRSDILVGGRADPAPTGDAVVEISGSERVVRSPLAWDGVAAEVVRIGGGRRVDIRFRSPFHLIVLHDRGARSAGETSLAGTPTSTLKDFGKRLTFVPAGCAYQEWLEPRAPVRITYFYFAPQRVAGLDRSGGALAPRLFFEDEALFDSMRKLQSALELPALRDPAYLAALATMLVHELARVGLGSGRELRQGGLAPWQERRVAAYIDDHLGEEIRLATLADIARLSPFHFCRAFKQTFGIPPHRYHTHRRIEHAKDLLAERRESVTDIGLTVGYSETSSFIAAFRKSTGLTPTAYRRNLG